MQCMTSISSGFTTDNMPKALCAYSSIIAHNVSHNQSSIQKFIICEALDMITLSAVLMSRYLNFSLAKLNVLIALRTALTLVSHMSVTSACTKLVHSFYQLKFIGVGLFTPPNFVLLSSFCGLRNESTAVIPSTGTLHDVVAHYNDSHLVICMH